MSTVVLIEASPFNASTGAPVEVRLAGGGSGRPYRYLGFEDWRAGVANLPRYSASLGFDQGGFTGGALPTTGGLAFYPSDRSLLTRLAGYVWDGAFVTVSLVDDESPNPTVATTFRGTVAAIKTSGGEATFTVSDLSRQLDRPLCPDTFAGTGGAEGGEDATGRIKRRSFGYVWNVEGRLLDKAHSIYEFGDPARQLTAFAMVKDKGREAGDYVDVPWAGSVAATLAALIASEPEDGGCAVAPSIACAKWYTTPAGPLTADIVGEGGNTPPTIAASILGAYAPSITIANLPDASAWRSAPAGLHCDQASETIANGLDRLLLPVSTAWIMRGDGAFVFRRITWANPTETLAADTIARDATFRPLRTRRVGYQRNQRQHSDAEISVTLLTGADITYADGTPIEVLKPGEKGATNDKGGSDARGVDSPPSYYRDKYLLRLRSEFKEANAIGAPPNDTSYGTLETFAQWADDTGGPVWQRFTNGLGQRYTRLSTSGAAWGTWQPEFSGNRRPGFGGDITESLGGPLALLNAFKTVLGTSAGFTGQGALATRNSLALGSAFLTGFGTIAGLNSLANGSSYLTGFGALSSLASIAFGGDYLKGADGTPATDSRYLTSLGIAGGFAGQGLLATLSYIRFGGPASGYAGVFNEGGTAYATDGGYRTIQGIAAGFTGQGLFATAPNINSANVGSYFSFSAFQLGYSITRSDGATVVSESLVVTQIGISAGFAGQGALATASSISQESQLGGNIATRIQGHPQNLARLDATWIAYGDGSGVNNYKPQDVNSNRTEIRIAAAFSGQGSLATLSLIRFGGPVSGYAGVLNEAGSAYSTDGGYFTGYGISAGFSGQGGLATKNQVGAGDIGQSAVQRTNFQILEQPVYCPVGN